MSDFSSCQQSCLSITCQWFRRVNVLCRCAAVGFKVLYMQIEICVIPQIFVVAISVPERHIYFNWVNQKGYTPALAVSGSPTSFVGIRKNGQGMSLASAQRGRVQEVLSDPNGLRLHPRAIHTKLLIEAPGQNTCSRLAADEARPPKTAQAAEQKCSG